ncbi:hypothetical protein AOLI_G00320580 [Acnodon oligacanthus]
MGLSTPPSCHPTPVPEAVPYRVAALPATRYLPKTVFLIGIPAGSCARCQQRSAWVTSRSQGPAADYPSAQHLSSCPPESAPPGLAGRRPQTQPEEPGMRCPIQQGSISRVSGGFLPLGGRSKRSAYSTSC